MSTLPFEFIVEGPPLSHQTENRVNLDRWRSRVRAAASTGWMSVQPISESIKLTVTYYHEGEFANIDNDNMVKPIQDALNGLVYVDDRQITHLEVVKTSIDHGLNIRTSSPRLTQAFEVENVFLHVVVELAPRSIEARKR